MSRFTRMAFLTFMLCLLPACARGEEFNFPTAMPTEFLPTSIALTVAAGRPPETATPAGTLTPPPQPTSTSTAPPTATSTPTDTATPTASFTPSITPTASNTPVPAIPLAEIELRTPGSLSKVTSPIPVRAFVIPGHLGRVTVELLGEDGRLLSRQIVTLADNLGRKVGLAMDLAFEIPGVSELGRLQLMTVDAFNRPKAIMSVDVILLSEGTADLNLVLDFLAHVMIKDPRSSDLIQGGTLVVSGAARPTTSLPFLAELIDEQGRVVGQRLFDVEAGNETDHRPFFVEIPYTVTEPTRVRLVIRERSDRIPGTIYLISLEILISP